MKKIIFAALLSLPIFLTAGQYVAVHGGPDYGKKTDASNSGQKVGFQVGGVYGYNFANQYRGEVEVSFRDAHKRKVYTEKSTDQLVSKKYESKQSWSYMVNGIYDVNQLAMYSISPYVGAGIGWGNNVAEYKTKVGKISETEKRRDSDFAWQLIAGITYPVSEGIKANVRYCYHNGQQHTKNHSMTVGVSKAF